MEKTKTHSVDLFYLDPDDIADIMIKSVVRDTINEEGETTYREKLHTNIEIMSKSGVRLKVRAHTVDITRDRKDIP